jgi:hypothetical protein
LGIAQATIDLSTQPLELVAGGLGIVGDPRSWGQLALV